MKKMNKTVWLTGILVLLAPMVSQAVPLSGGYAYLDRSSSSSIFEIDASGYMDLSLSFMAIGGGTIDECGSSVNGDCFAVRAAGTDILSGLSATRSWQQYSAALPVGDSIFQLAFEAHITGGDESIAIDWQVDGATQVRPPADERVLIVDEPSILLLLGLGLAVIGFARRRNN